MCGRKNFWREKKKLETRKFLKVEGSKLAGGWQNEKYHAKEDKKNTKLTGSL